MANLDGDFGVCVDGADSLHHFGDVFGDDDVNFLVVEDAFGAHACGDDGLAQGHRLDDFDADATAREQRHYGHIMVGDEFLGIGHLADYFNMLVLQCGEPFGHGTSCQMIDEGGHLLHGLRKHFVDEPAYAFRVGHPVHGANMVELGLTFNLVFWCKLLRINAIRDVDDGLGAIFPEEGGVFARDCRDTVDGLQGV